MNAATLNEALEMAMEWGEHWLRPIHGRLARAHPELSQGELELCDATARQVMTLAFDLIYAASPGDGLLPDETSLRDRMGREVLGQFPWVSEGNLGRLYSQGVYYAMK